MKTILFVLLAITTSLSAAYSQTQFCGWLASFNTVKLNNKFGAYFDGQLRSTDQVKGTQTLLLRPGIHYQARKDMTLSSGYAYISNRRTAGAITGYMPEHRIWEQVTIAHKVRHISISHRLRLEQRFIAKHIVSKGELKKDGHTYANRFRYFFRGIVPFNGKANFSKGTFGSFQNEVFLNVGDNTALNGKVFDQNRLYFSVGYRFSKLFDAELGYMNQYIAGSNTATTNNHIVQCATYLRL